MALRFTAAPADPALLRLPWSVPLEHWSADEVVSLPRGISRHVVRFVQVNGALYAAKELGARAAEREYRLLRILEREQEPAVRPVGLVLGRTAADGEELTPVLVTRHLEFSLPYRLLFSGFLAPDTVERLLDALVLLLVRLHLRGFHWGDCSLSNVLFRRDAGALAAYLVDAETGEFHPEGLTDGQRAYDIELARTNIAGELLDLEAAGQLHESIDPIETADAIEARYRRLWNELYAVQRIPADATHLLERRIRRLNELGFDVEELELVTDESGSSLELKPKVVEPDHHHRRLLSLIGMEVQENQARVLLGDMASFRVAEGLTDDNEQVVAHRWLTELFRPTIEAIPPELRRKLEPAELYHQVLEHRWYMSEEAGRDVGLEAAIASYVRDELVARPDEQAVLGTAPPPPADADDS